MHPKYRGIALLLSLGSLPVACKDKEADDTAGTTDTGNGPDPGTESAGTTTPVDPTTGPDGTSTSTSSTSTGPDPSGTTTSESTTFLTNNSTTTPTTVDTEDSDTGPPQFPPPRNPVCQSFLDHYVECFPRYRDYGSYAGYACDQYIMYGMQADGQACADAIEAMFACFSTVACDVGPEGCAEQEMAIEAACPSFDQGETETSATDGGSSSTG
jgi:hypothetical protein